MDQPATPNLINPIDNPKLVFTSQNNIVSDLIEIDEDGNWGINMDVSHMMTMTIAGFFNSQSPAGFNQVPVTAYMTPGTKIVIIDFVNMTPQAYHAMCLVVNERLGKQGYDWLQIIGQAIGLDFLHMPGTEDCSEEGVREMKGTAPYLLKDKDLIDSIPNQSTPQEVLTTCLKNSASFGVSGIYTFANSSVPNVDGSSEKVVPVADVKPKYN